MTGASATHTILLVVSGTSGSGKSSVVRRLLELDDTFARAITATTRSPRGSETNGVDYYFRSEDAFRADLAAGRLLEHADVYGRLYGTPRASVDDVLNAGQHCVLVVDVQGVNSLVRDETLADRIRTVFVRTAELPELERRLRARGEDDAETIARRLAAAEVEESHVDDYDLVLVNDDLEAAVGRLRAFVAESVADRDSE